MLGFVASCNRSSYYPTVEHVELWRENPEPREAEYRTVEVERPADIAGHALAARSFSDSILGASPGSFRKFTDSIAALQHIQPVARGIASTMSAIMSGPTTYRKKVREAESPTEHLVRLKWLEEAAGTADDEPGLKLTDLGWALLRDREREGPADEDLTVVVLAKDDPIAYALLMKALSGAGAGMLIDPYLEVDILHQILVTTSLTRLLVRVPTNKNQKANLAAIETYLDSGRLYRTDIEVRMSSELHDRYVLSEDDGEVLMLGTSLNGVSKKNTVLISMPEPAGKATRKAYEKIWDTAELVGPQPAADEDGAEGEDGGADDAEAAGDDEQGQAGRE